MNNRLERTVSSMLWAAWADALGFISELTSEENLRRRTNGHALTWPMAWSRNVGGRMGVRVDLPEGCYSDDTQLRLATSRAISSHGFDVEAFSRVELTVWPSYSLGGGRASKAAAASMARAGANWANNVFKGWETAGGNGAAMRIQPHVYAAPQLDDLHYVDDVIRNAIVTHGHPRGIVGAVFHAVSLAFALDQTMVPGPVDFAALLEATRESLGAFARQPELAAYWVPQWERTTGTSFGDAWHKTVDELEGILKRASGTYNQMRMTANDRWLAQQSYEELVRVLRLDDPEVRGSGTLTAAAALILASAFPDHPAQSAQIAASRLHTDTDTIGTMAAAIVGAAAPRDLLSAVLDHDYIVDEARRLYAVSQGLSTGAFPYPDLLLWQPPKSAIDSTGESATRLALAGLSELDVIGEPTVHKDSVWVWTRTAFGQSVLVKHRRELRELTPNNRPLTGYGDSKRTPAHEVSDETATSRNRKEAGQQGPIPHGEWNSRKIDGSVDHLLERLELQGFQDADLGRAFRDAAVHASGEDFERFVTLCRQRLKSVSVETAVNHQRS